MRTVKMIATPKFSLELSQLSNGMYVISYEVDGMVMVGQQFLDYGIATAIFDARLQVLQGN